MDVMKQYAHMHFNALDIATYTYSIDIKHVVLNIIMCQ